MRLLRICKDNHIHRLADFSHLTFRDMLSFPECGKATAMNVKQMLKDNGMDFSLKNHRCEIPIHTLRDNLIVELVEHGRSYREVGRQFRISHSRVAQIYKQHGSRLS